MSKHNILFFSSHPQDKLSQEILGLLNSDPLLSEQFVKICVNSPGIKLPRMIVERNEVPVIITRGFNQPISGQAALDWINQHENSDKALGLDYGDVDKAAQISEDHGILASESGRTSYHQAFNDDWNAGAENDVRTINSQFSSIEDTNNMDTLEEQGKHNTKGLKRMMDRRMKNRDFERIQDVRGLGDPNRRGDGSMSLGQLGAVGGGNLRGGGEEGMAPMYNPYPNGQPQVPDLPIGLRPVETNPSRQPQQPGFNDFSRLMGEGSGRGGMSQPTPMRTRDGLDFPTPMQNPLYPPARGAGGRGRKGPGDFPAMPPGFGGAGGGTSLDNAYNGQSLMGTPMKGHKQSKFNDRREKSLGPGLPVGRGHAGPFNQMVSTSGGINGY